MQQTKQDKLAWWLDTVNSYGERGTTTLALDAALGGDTRVRRRLGHPDPILEVSPVDLRELTNTPAGRYKAAIVARVAADPQRGDHALWKVLGTVGAIAALLTGIQLSTGQYTGWILLTGALAVIGVTLAVPVARWAIARQRSQFYRSITAATDTAGEDAAFAYAQGGFHQHTTVLDNLLAGRPLTPRGTARAILATTGASAGQAT